MRAGLLAGVLHPAKPASGTARRGFRFRTSYPPPGGTRREEAIELGRSD